MVARHIQLISPNLFNIVCSLLFDFSFYGTNKPKEKMPPPKPKKSSILASQVNMPPMKLNNQPSMASGIVPNKIVTATIKTIQSINFIFYFLFLLLLFLLSLS